MFEAYLFDNTRSTNSLTYWTNFAKTGNPNGNGLPVWPLYNTQKEEIVDIGLDGKPIAKRDPRKASI